ncbi:hypothetical protein H6F88_09815 [Oculatella sp. FACHB-28]|uniref:hypothetical protein n=1 Tax=Oculatella sp. FACHB-28 TaxID=2692845 RepID=UPI0016864977|nr:hypothetical protein [Oculatella sp. FACHB-28]MBD2056311.1 hypothetical protein [Oculatella sp. FACHB-28]
MTTRRGEVLVAILNNVQDMKIACEQHWYRILVESVEKFLKQHWAPEWLAFYQTKVFGNEGYAVNYYARVQNICKVYRCELFPDEALNEKSQRQYYQLKILALQRLNRAVVSDLRHRISFIPTTLEKLKTATKISDLPN